MSSGTAADANFDLELKASASPVFSLVDLVLLSYMQGSMRIKSIGVFFD